MVAVPILVYKWDDYYLLASNAIVAFQSNTRD